MTGRPPEASVFISAITEAELCYGARITPPGKRQTALVAEIEGMIGEDFGGRILLFDSPAAVAFAEIAAQRRQAGRSLRPTHRLPQSLGPAVHHSPPVTYQTFHDVALK